MSDEPEEVIDEPAPVEEEEIINQIVFTNSSDAVFEVWCDGAVVRDIKPNSCFGYMVQPNMDVTIKLKA